MLTLIWFMSLMLSLSIILLACCLSNNAAAPLSTRVKRDPSCSVSMCSRDAIVASGVRPWGDEPLGQGALGDLFVAQRPAGLVEYVVGGVEVGGHVGMYK